MTAPTDKPSRRTRRADQDALAAARRDRLADLRVEAEQVHTMQPAPKPVPPVAMSPGPVGEALPEPEDNVAGRLADLRAEITAPVSSIVDTEAESTRDSTFEPITPPDIPDRLASLKFAGQEQQRRTNNMRPTDEGPPAGASQAPSPAEVASVSPPLEAGTSPSVNEAPTAHQTLPGEASPEQLAPDESVPVAREVVTPPPRKYVEYAIPLGSDEATANLTTDPMAPAWPPSPAAGEASSPPLLVSASEWHAFTENWYEKQRAGLDTASEGEPDGGAKGDARLGVFGRLFRRGKPPAPRLRPRTGAENGATAAHPATLADLSTDAAGIDEPVASLTFIAGPLAGKTVSIASVPVLIGSSPSATVRLPLSGGVAPSHARIWKAGEHIALKNLDGHTTIGGQPLPLDIVMLEDTDVIEIGEHRIRFHAELDRGPELALTTALEGREHEVTPVEDK